MGIKFTRSFIAFWGATFLYGLYAGGIWTTAFVAVAMGMVISHELAHARECRKLGLPVHEIRFVWWGGYVATETESRSDSIRFFLAGVKDTAWYTIVFTLSLCMVYVAGHTVTGFNFAMNMPLNTLSSITLLGVMMCIGNVLPIRFTVKRWDAVITSDGWAAYQIWKARGTV